MARFAKPQDTLPQKDEAEKRWTIHYYGGTRTGHLSTKSTSNLANSQHIPCHTTATLQRKWSLWSQLPWTTTGATRRGRGIRNWNNPKPAKTRTGLPIPHQMARVPNFRCVVGTGNIIFEWWWHPRTLQTATWTQVNMNSSEHEQYKTLIDQMYNVEEELWKIKNVVETRWHYSGIYDCSST